MSQPMSPRQLLESAFQAAVRGVQADNLLPPHLPALPARGRLLVIAVGKAAADMVACVEAHYPPDVSLTGMAITRHGHALPSQRIPVLEAGHPLPDAQGLAGAQELLQIVQDATPADHILALLSGGGSSLLTLPMAGLGLEDVQATVRALLQSGAPIADINCVRKHLSRTLGGRLAQASTAPVTALLLSDVVGDDISVIASGPFAPDPSRYVDALAVLQNWQVDVPVTIRAHLQLGARGGLQETPKPGDPCFARVDTRIVGNGLTALEASARHLAGLGVEVEIWGDHFVGEARDLAHDFAQRIRRIQAQRGASAPARMFLSGGETQVTVQGRGRGGRNTEFLLALALQDLPGVHALAADTDGIDGNGDNAGAVLTPDTLARAGNLGLDARAHLANNDAYGFFAALGDLLVTGPTRTNANDFRGILLG